MAGQVDGRDITDIEIINAETIENREEMRRLLISQFQDSVLYKLYEKKGRLQELFTYKILDMDKYGEYSSKEAAEICEVQDYTINNRRSALVDYVDPKYRQMNSKNWKHDYISVFKLKMIIGLTGQNGDYSLRQVKAMLYGDLEDTTDNPQTEAMHKMFAQMQRVFEDAQELYQRNEQLLLDAPIQELQEKLDSFEKTFAEQSEKLEKKILEQTEEQQKLEKQLVEQAEQQQLLEKANQELTLVKEKCNEIYDLINDTNSSVPEKEEIIKRYDALVKDYPDHRDLIMSYHTYSINKVFSLKEISQKQLKDRAKDLHNKVMDESLSTEQRNRAMDDLERLFNDNADYQDKLYHFLYDAKTSQRNSRHDPVPEKKKGLFARLFSK